MRWAGPCQEARRASGTLADLGIAPAGGKLPPEMRATALEGIRRGMNVLSGLHRFLSEDAELAEAARL